MRLFLAIDIPEDVKKSLQNQLVDLRHEYRVFRWVEPQNYHITLFNFGNMFTPQKIKGMVEESVFEVPPFRMYSQEIDLLMRNEIMLYVGFARNPTLEDMVKKMKEQFKLYEEYSFFPHLTIARTRIPSKQQYLLIKKKFTNHTVEMEFDVTHLKLFESTVVNNQPHYKLIDEYPLYMKEV